MATAAYSGKRHQDRHVSLTRLTVVLASLALWATLIAGAVLIAR